MAVTDIEAKPKISGAEMERRRAALRYAVAHSRIEGQSMSPEGSAIFEEYVRGEISEAEIDRRLHSLHCRV